MALCAAEGVAGGAGGTVALLEPDRVSPLAERAAENDTVPLVLREGVLEVLAQPEALARPVEVGRSEGWEAGVALRRGLRVTEGDCVRLGLDEGVVVAEGQRELLVVCEELREVAGEGDCEPRRDAVRAVLGEEGLEAVPEGLHEG